MTIQEMHIAFRTLGQQMGIQLIRGILPESIDTYLNNAIIEKTRVELLQGVVTNSKVSSQPKVSTMSSINAFRNLFRTARYQINKADIGSNNKVNTYNSNNGYYIINLPISKKANLIKLDKNEYYFKPITILGFSVEYDNAQRGNSVNCRIVGSDEIENTLSDYCNKPDKDYPVVCINNFDNFEGTIEIDGNKVNTQIEVYTNTEKCDIKYLNIKYIKYPNVVKFDEVAKQYIDCDLPEHLHDEIVEMAVRKFQASIGNVADNSQE